MLECGLTVIVNIYPQPLSVYVSVFTCFTVPDDSVLVSGVFIKRPWHFLWFIILRSSIWSDSFASSLAHSSCYNMTSILSEFHLEHEGPRTNNPELASSVLESISPLRSDAFWIQNTKIVWIFLLSSDAAWLQLVNIFLRIWLYVSKICSLSFGISAFYIWCVLPPVPS